MSSFADKLRTLDVDDALELAGRALEVMGTLAGAANGKNAKDLVMAIRHVFHAVENAVEGRITPDEAYAALDKFRDAIAGNDAAIDQAVADKFGVDPDPEDS